VLPLLKSKPDEVKLMTALTGMCNNGLRTLVCGYSQLPHAWWLKYADEYERVSQMGPSKASEGHGENPRKCKRDECEKCLQHNLFQKIELDANLQYLGCTGLEDQLQQLVPECIQDCLRAGIKVWMITGDKLETARNIGMACNLIDSDMAPQIEDGDDVKKCLDAFNNARLLEITGQWASLVNNKVCACVVLHLLVCLLSCSCSL
jgi:magnesium-transporting ATPase (P-type)